jgi:hypothetical protein
MLIRYEGKTFDIEPPLESHDEVHIEVERYAEFPGIKSDVRQKNKVRAYDEKKCY